VKLIEFLNIVDLGAHDPPTALGSRFIYGCGLFFVVLVYAVTAKQLVTNFI